MVAVDDAGGALPTSCLPPLWPSSPRVRLPSLRALFVGPARALATSGPRAASAPGSSTATATSTVSPEIVQDCRRPWFASPMARARAHMDAWSPVGSPAAASAAISAAPAARPRQTAVAETARATPVNVPSTRNVESVSMVAEPASVLPEASRASSSPASRRVLPAGWRARCGHILYSHLWRICGFLSVFSCRRS